MSTRRSVAFGSTVVLAGCFVCAPASVWVPFGPKTTGAAVQDAVNTRLRNTPRTALSDDVLSVPDRSIADGAVPAPGALLPPEPMPVTVANSSDPVLSSRDDAERSIKTDDDCAMTESCINQYLWSVYQRAPKIDTMELSDRIKVTVTKNGKERAVTKTITKLVDEDFAWKDLKAAKKAGMSLQEYVIGGMDRNFKLKLYRALRAMDNAGLAPGITSGFRDDYRQSLATGHKAAIDSSYHGGSRHGGYGHGLAADLVSVKGATRADRSAASQKLWQWIDVHGQEFAKAWDILLDWRRWVTKS